jgi:CRISPR/Cas system-associated protein Cas7 (RAMP superfamily)
MDNSGKMLQICDKNMIISCIWNKCENPFTRSSLTIEELEKLNENEESIEKIKEFNKILKSAIDFSKK